MVERRKPQQKGTGPGSDPPFSAKRFESSPEFAVFKAGMRKLISVPKSRLDELVRKVKAESPRAGNPNAAGRKKRISP